MNSFWFYYTVQIEKIIEIKTVLEPCFRYTSTLKWKEETVIEIDLRGEWVQPWTAFSFKTQKGLSNFNNTKRLGVCEEQSAVYYACGCAAGRLCTFSTMSTFYRRPGDKAGSVSHVSVIITPHSRCQRRLARRNHSAGASQLKLRPSVHCWQDLHDEFIIAIFNSYYSSFVQVINT